MNAFDDDRLGHMLDAANTALRLASGRTRNDLDEDEGLVLALAKAIEMVGEAARHVSDSTKKDAPSIPWAQIIAMRNRLVHAYFDINLDVLWQTVEIDLPALIPVLETLAPPESE